MLTNFNPREPRELRDDKPPETFRRRLLFWVAMAAFAAGALAYQDSSGTGIFVWLLGGAALWARIDR